jgi:hypothetical protein
MAMDINDAFEQHLITKAEHNDLLNLTVGDPHPQYLLRTDYVPGTGEIDWDNVVINCGTF